MKKYDKFIPEVDSNLEWENKHRRTVIQVAELEVEGDKIVCDRDKKFYSQLVSPKAI